MTPSKPLSGHALIDCARASASSPIEVAARQSGYGENVKGFEKALNEACEELGIEGISFKTLASQAIQRPEGLEIAPETLNKL